MTQPVSTVRIYHGAQTDMPRVVKRHLFVLCPNNSGSTFLSKALATSPEVWSLVREGQHALGFVGPVTIGRTGLNWAADTAELQALMDPGRFDWAKNQQAWYFQARATAADAPVFVSNTPMFLAYPDMLAAHFCNTRFVMMVRNPYPVIEGIFRRNIKFSRDAAATLAEAVAHVIACMEMQRQNRWVYRDTGVFFTYEEMCANPAGVAHMIKALVPEIKTLQLDQRLPVKGQYNEHLRNMNAAQIARLSAPQINLINERLAPHRDLLAHFGYDLIGAG